MSCSIFYVYYFMIFCMCFNAGLLFATSREIKQIKSLIIQRQEFERGLYEHMESLKADMVTKYYQLEEGFMTKLKELVLERCDLLLDQCIKKKQL